jgi:hypothetical protein
MTRNQWLPVRCCCDGDKVLGFLSVTEEEARQQRTISRPMIGDLMPWQINNAHQLNVERVSIEIRCINLSHGNYEFAVYSDDRDVEFWRTVSGFVEAK